MHADHSGRKEAREEGETARTLLSKSRQESAYAGGEPILEVRDLVKHYPLTQGILIKKQVGAVKAVDGVTFDLGAGETLGVVGESGCGKSTVARLLVQLEKPTAGAIRYKGEDITKLSGRALKAVRRNIQMVFQDPYTSLNPRMTVGDIIGEPYEIHPEVAPKGSRRRKVQELLDVVGLNPEYINRYPHQFSGGQRQRIGIARGLALNPEIIVADEPVSALDVSVQAQVVNLLDRLQAEFNLSYVFIAHDLSIVRHISDRVGVMYLGRFIEIGTDAEIYDHPTHPYTQALLSAVPVPDPAAREFRERIILHGDVPSPANPPSGCRFRTRCWKAQERCELEVPLLAVPAAFLEVDTPARHPSACHFAEEKRVVPPEGTLDSVPGEGGQEEAAARAADAAEEAPERPGPADRDEGPPPPSGSSRAV
ncbi:MULTISPECIES: ABC transporter ATP-binding protein [Streptomyces]|uniref:Dipeptide ABC transporter ATP-binding protein n=1 Tax=Streptomyces drozdowiczii TaxID=202862 RepID=A0ABY6PQS3_9ACTN|nr:MULTISPECIES: dipeptide ABC transporter ATP-binding protein [Streptomyces]MCX0245832.1 dipeptide ABC transporter ATP-binding protein [Streptomyces drozdowiczii]OKJ77985.1 peptide ABC transporter ATP-binding protein [Streptomyces sp. CB02460]UZK54577.1 dipeptide ABC transporter ATP-binding protein [Streptomyces drozdowiczii]